MDKRFFCKIKKLFFPCQDNKYKPGFLNSKFLLYYAVLLLILKLAVMPFLFYFPRTGFFADLTKIGLFEMANASRQQLGYQPLKENPALNQAAYLKAQDMLEKGYFAHNSPEGITPWYWLERSGYNYTAAGENLAIGFLESEQVHRAWMDSPSHKRNILNPNYQEMGIAVLKGDFQGRETSLVVQFFGNPRVTHTPEFQPEAPGPTPLPEEDQTAEVIEEEPIKEDEVLPEETPEPLQPPEEEQVVVPAEEEIMGEDEEIPEEKPVFVAETVRTTDDIEKTPALMFFQFMTSDYYNIIQGIVYSSLVLILISLFITVFYDVFIYRKFKIDHKDIVVKTVGFSALWLALLLFDKMIMVELLNPQEFLIYPASFI